MILVIIVRSVPETQFRSLISVVFVGRIKMALDFVAGCLGGCAGILVGHPLDTVKIRIQTQNWQNPRYKGTIDCLRTVVRQESILGLYKGMSSPLAGVAVINAIVFGVYGNIQRRIPEPESLTSHFISGSISGILQSFICSPMELVKSRMQIQTRSVSEGPFRALNRIRETEGICGVFKGLNITFLREGIGFGVYFASYEYLTRTESPESLCTVHLLAAGGTSGAASWLFTYPLDVIKSRLQIDGASGTRKYKNSWDCLKKSAQAEGVRFLFRGLSPTLVRAFPTNAATWAVVTWVLKMFQPDENPSSQCVKTESLDATFWSDFPSVDVYTYEFSLVHNLYLKYLADKST